MPLDRWWSAASAVREAYMEPCDFAKENEDQERELAERKHKFSELSAAASQTASRA
jgi:hypothetical protein